MIRAALIGSSGKMGLEIIAASEENIELSYFVSRKKSADKKVVLLKDLSAKKIDLVIDFSNPEAMILALKWCVKNKISFLSGTTGLTKDQEKEVIMAAKVIPVFWASNFSVGVALVTDMLKVFSKYSDFDFQIEEVHHRHKKDRPSGTAKTLQATLEKLVGKDLPEPASIRGGGIFGIHKIWAMSSSETITIEHSALNRSVFAEGAVRAALWLAEQKPGNYTMNDLLKG